MELPNSNQVAAAGRHALTFAMGALSAAATLHVISSGDATTLANSLNQISTGVTEIAAGVAPIVAIVSAWYAAWSASRKSQIAAINNSDNGVKVVAETVQAPKVNAPLK